MSQHTDQHLLEQQIGQWRSYLSHRQAIHSSDIRELEDHLREQVSGLMESGLSPDEAFLVAVKRLGELDALSREFAREHSERLWKQLVVSARDGDAPSRARKEAVVAVFLAIAAAVAIKLPSLFGLPTNGNESFYLRNASLFVLPILTGFFAWKRQLLPASLRWVAVAFLAAAIAANIHPLVPEGSTEILLALHLPIALWFAVGVVYAGGRWNQAAGRMDFIRFSGELFIYYVLIALGGGVLMGFMAMIFQAIGYDIEPIFESWILPCGVMGAVVIASWLVEAKQSVIENMAPVLTRLFTPMFAALMVAFLATLVVTGRGVNMEREMLIVFDLLLIVVLGLLLYSASARDPHAPAGVFDWLQLTLLISALLVDAVALWAISARISEFGLSPNRVAALGLNIILLVNLAWSALLYSRFLRGGGSFAKIEKWQTDYLPVYAAWAAVVVLVFPPFFRYI